jgi:hypothetical protein
VVEEEKKPDYLNADINQNEKDIPQNIVMLLVWNIGIII